jgi:general secretion pathway protein J
MTRPCPSGFTLLEMLLSMTLLSLLLVALFGGLRFVGRDNARVEAVLEDSQNLDLVRDLLIRQVGNAFPVMAGADGGGRALFTGRPDRLAFPILRLPGQGPAGLILAVFDITASDGIHRLIYREYPFLPGAAVAIAEQPTRSTLLVESREALGFRYYDKAGLWQDQWSNPATPPRLVALHNPVWPELIAGLRAEPVPP